MRTVLVAFAASLLVLGACQINPVGGPPIDTDGDGNTDGATDGSGSGSGSSGFGGGTDGTGGSTDGSGGSTDGTDGTGTDGTGTDGTGTDGSTDGSTDDTPTGCASAADCDDSDACTTDSCNDATGDCEHAPVTCEDDGIPCSVESCDPVAGCSSDTSPCECLEDGDCSDGLACNGEESCSAWTCQDGVPFACDDGISCTDDQCVETPDGPTCEAPVKTGRCYIAESCYLEGDVNPDAACEACHFDSSSVAWSALPIGSPCDGGSGVCGEDGCVETPEKLPEHMVFVPAGEFGMGCAAPAYCDPDEEPKHDVFVSAFGIDRTETTVAEYRVCELEGICPEPGDGYKSTYWAGTKEDHPVNHVSWEAALTFCEWRETRLCTEAEWERAARGGDDRTFPWGEEAPGCDLANLYIGGELGCGTDSTSPVASLPGGEGPYGTFDQGGNVWEYVADYYDKYYYDVSESVNPTGPATGTQRVVRGGSWKSSPNDLSTFRRHVGDSPHEARGIRCCWSPGD